jgi:chemotaxis signal transduction protein
MSAASSGRESFVVFPLGSRRFALLTAEVVELCRAGLVQEFPHTTTGLAGVLVRRGEVLPVWDVATLLGKENAAQRFWLVTRRNSAGEEPTAIPVSGECQMLRAEMLPPPDGSAEHVRGVLVLEGQPVEVLDLARLAVPCGRAALRECAEKREEE